MKNKFIGYYSSDGDYENEVWDDSILIVDTNVLLDIYRVSPETSNDLKNVLKSYAERDCLWIPYQVAKEYHEELYHVVYEQMKKFDSTYKCLNDFKEKINQKRNHPFLDKEQFQQISEMADKIRQTFDDRKKELKKYVKGESLKTEIADIFEGRVGDEPTNDELEKIRKDGEKRYKDKIPPGFEDGCKECDKRYGDLIIWKQIISYAKDNHRHVIFVSSDTKDDWYLKEGSQLIMPHPCLFQEFMKETGRYILIYSLELFLKIVKDKGVVNVNDESIVEVQAKPKTEHGNNVSGRFLDRDRIAEICENVIMGNSNS